MAARRRRPPAATRARGAALIILMALLSMGVLYFIVLQLEAVSQYQKDALQGGGRDSLAQAREALLGYATTYRDDPDHTTEVFGYLPCPDTDGDGDAEASLWNCRRSQRRSASLQEAGLARLARQHGWLPLVRGFRQLQEQPQGDHGRGTRADELGHPGPVPRARRQRRHPRCTGRRPGRSRCRGVRRGLAGRRTKPQRLRPPNRAASIRRKWPPISMAPTTSPAAPRSP
jgi:hypothetical protein